MRWKFTFVRARDETRFFRCLPAAFCAVLLGACAAELSRQPAPVPEFRPGLLAGYLSSAETIDSAAILPPPPPAGSAEAATDEAVNRAALRLRGTERWQLAIRDANVKFPEATARFSCALAAPIDAAHTPYLYQLLRRAASDASAAADGAKDLYERDRPFVINRQPPCTPEEMHGAGTKRSYPSGHSARGMVWALILAELAPDRAVPLLKRGQAYAESRVLCNMHWPSDTVEGRFVGAYAYSRLQASPGFRADLQVARQELAAVRARKLLPAEDCQAEARALETRVPLSDSPGSRQ